MVHRPVRKNCAPINKLAGHGAENARIIRADTVIAHDEVTVFRDAYWTKVAHILVLRRHVRLVDGVAIDVHNALPNLNILTR